MPHVLNYVARIFEIMHNNSETPECKAIASLHRRKGENFFLIFF